MRLRECEVVYRTRSVNGLTARTVQSSETVYAVMGPIARDRACESLWAVMLDARSRITAVHEVARGGVASVAVTAADVFRAAVITGATAIVLVHNHPSGETAPSGEDLSFTERLIEAGKLLGVSVLDHVIIGADGYCSMLDAGYPPFRKK